MHRDEILILEQRLAELSSDVYAIERAMEQADPKLKETYAVRLQSIQERRRQIADRLAELRLKKALAWEEIDFATGVERVLDRIGQGLDRITSRRH